MPSWELRLGGRQDQPRECFHTPHRGVRNIAGSFDTNADDPYFNRHSRILTVGGHVRQHDLLTVMAQRLVLQINHILLNDGFCNLLAVNVVGA